MSRNREAPSLSAVELGDLLSGTVGAIVRAQEELDEHARRRREDLERAPLGGLALPSWGYAFTNVAVELEMSASVAGAGPTIQAGRAQGARLLCRTLDPGSVGLYGYQASSGLRVRLLLAARPLPTRGAPELSDVAEREGAHG